MASKIDYKAIFNPILTILEFSDVSAEQKVKLVSETIRATLDEKTVPEKSKEK